LVREEVAAIGKARLMAEVQKAALRLTQQQATIWQQMGRYTKGVAVNVRDITSQLASWGKLTGVFSGLLGAGGLYGITRMAEGVSANRQSAQGVGATYGGHQAFNLNFGRFVGSGFLESISKYRSGDTTSLNSLGLGEKELEGPTEEVGQRALQAIWNKAHDKNNDPKFDDFLLSSTGLDKHVSLEEFKKLRETSAEELSAQMKNFGRDTTNLGVSQADQLAFQNLTTQLGRAATEVETILVKGLGKAAPEIEKLSMAVVDTVKAFSENGGLASLVKDLADAIKEVTKFVRDPIGYGKDILKKEIGKEAEGFKRDADNILNFWNRGFGKTGGSQTNGADPLTNIWNRGFGMKANAGELSPGLSGIAAELAKTIPGFKEVTAGNDAFHGGKGAHGRGDAFDFTLENGTKAAYAKAAAAVRAQLKNMGYDSPNVLDEANNPIKGHTTGPHLHVNPGKLNVNFYNATGADVVAAANMVAAGAAGI
jgi:hypothetical protein